MDGKERKIFRHDDPNIELIRPKGSTKFKDKINFLKEGKGLGGFGIEDYVFDQEDEAEEEDDVEDFVINSLLKVAENTSYRSRGMTIEVEQLNSEEEEKDQDELDNIRKSMDN